MARLKMALWVVVLMATLFTFGTYAQAAEDRFVMPKDIRRCAAPPYPDSLWTWYWTQRAWIHPAWVNAPCSAAHDAVSAFFARTIERVGAPLWNHLMAYDVVRAALLVIATGALLGLGMRMVGVK